MKALFLTILFFAFQTFAFAQVDIEKAARKHSCSCENEKAVREYLEQYETQQKFIAECELEAEKRRKGLNQKKPVRVSGFTPGAVNLVMPYYPKTAKRLNISGEILIEALADENGFVIYSKTLKGNAFLRERARKAACLSKFTPVYFCGKAIKTRWLIKYNFISN